MPIDVNHIQSGKVISSSTRSKSKRASVAEDSVEDNGSSQDSIEITGKAAQLQKLIGHMLSTPAVDSGKIMPIKHKVDNDTYEIDNQQVANKILEFESIYGEEL